MLQLLALGALAGSSLLGAYGQMKAGEAANDAAKMNADWATTEGEIASRRYLEQARQSRMMTAVNLYRQGKYTDEVRGAQKVSIAKSGFSLDDPTSQSIFRETDETASIDEWLIRFGGSMEAIGYEYQAADARTQGAMKASASRYEGKMAKATGKLGAVSSLLSGAANLYTGYKTLNPGKVG